MLPRLLVLPTGKLLPKVDPRGALLTALLGVGEGLFLEILAITA